MKKRIPTFLAGMLTAALIGGLGVTALAASGQMTITVDPINIQVNGQTFQPKDEKGNDVPVFALNGTTYAPLRALAEAYGLTVGYDQAANMATVGETTTPDTTAPSNDYSDWTAEEEAAYLEFKGMWEVRDLVSDNSGGWHDYHAVYTGASSKTEFSKYWNVNTEVTSRFGRRFISEVWTQTDNLLWFDYGDTCIGQAVIYPNGNAYCSIYPLT